MSFFSRFGYPLTIFTDQGRNFESALFKAVCDLLKIHKTKTTAFRPSGNGQVERYNRTLMDAIRCYLENQQRNWDIYLPQLAGALRSSVCRSTGFTANKMMLGREINGPWDLVFGAPSLQSPENPNEYVVGLEKTIRKSHEIARNTLKTTQELMKKEYDVKVKVNEYEEGDAVYFYDTASLKSKCRKLSAPWKGPGVVTEAKSSSLYKIRLRNRDLVTHQDKLKLCRDRAVPLRITRFRDQLRKGETSPKPDEYCICRGPYNNRFMICCDECDEWYHGACVGVTRKDADSIDTYRCTPCCRI